MYIPNVQNIIAAGLALTGAYSASNALPILVFLILLEISFFTDRVFSKHRVFW